MPYVRIVRSAFISKIADRICPMPVPGQAPLRMSVKTDLCGVRCRMAVPRANAADARCRLLLELDAAAVVVARVAGDWRSDRGRDIRAGIGRDPQRGQLVAIALREAAIGIDRREIGDGLFLRPVKAPSARCWSPPRRRAQASDRSSTSICASPKGRGHCRCSRRPGACGRRRRWAGRHSGCRCSRPRCRCCRRNKAVWLAGQKAWQLSAELMPACACTGKKWPSQVRTQKALAGPPSPRSCSRGGLIASAALVNGSAKSRTASGNRRGASHRAAQPAEKPLEDALRRCRADDGKRQQHDGDDAGTRTHTLLSCHRPSRNPAFTPAASYPAA